MSGKITTNTNAKYIALEAVVTRADGTIENLGIIAEQHFSFLGKLKSFFKKVLK